MIVVQSITTFVIFSFQCGGFDVMMQAYSEMLQEFKATHSDHELCVRYIQIGKIL